MNKFNIGDKVISKGYPYLDEEVGVVVGIDTREDAGDGKYLVKFDSLDTFSGWEYEIFRNDYDWIIKPYEGYAEWVNEDDLVKILDNLETFDKEKMGTSCKEIIKNNFTWNIIVKKYKKIFK